MTPQGYYLVQESEVVKAGCQGHVQSGCQSLASGLLNAPATHDEGGAQPLTMTMVYTMTIVLLPLGTDWVAATLAGWSWLRHAQALVGWWTSRGLVPDSFHLVGADTLRPGWCGGRSSEVPQRVPASREPPPTRDEARPSRDGPRLGRPCCVGYSAGLGKK